MPTGPVPSKTFVVGPLPLPPPSRGGGLGGGWAIGPPVGIIVIATRNPGKLLEIKRFFSDLPVELVPLDRFPEIGEIVEDGGSFEGNALKKARFVASRLGRVTLADDSGLEVTALGRRPGVFSARYAGCGATDEENNAKLLREMEGVPDGKRGARFVCAIAIVTPEGRRLTARGVCRGKILRKGRGKNGFGYDPIFFIPSLGKTFAELKAGEKAKYGHRGAALAKIRSKLPSFRVLRLNFPPIARVVPVAAPPRRNKTILGRSKHLGYSGPQKLDHNRPLN